MKESEIVRKVAPALIVVLALVFGLPSHLRAEHERTNSSPAAVKQLGHRDGREGHAATVTVEVTFPDGAVFTVTQYENKPITLRSEGSFSLAFTPKIAADGDQVTLAAVNLSTGLSKDGRRLKGLIGPEEIGALELHSWDWTPGEFSFEQWKVTFKLLQIGKGQRSWSRVLKPASYEPRQGQIDGGYGGSCCITCGSNTACGCLATGICGSCCYGDCC